MKLFSTIFLLSAVIVSSSSAYAQESYATCDEAKALAVKGADLLKKDGADAAFAAFNDPNGIYRDRDLYIFVFDKNGFYKVHATKPVMVGKSVLPLKDVRGFAFGEAIMAVKDEAWVDYKYPDPANKDKLKDKRSYIIRVGDYVMGSGCYKN